jgi:peptide chain release factor 3
MQVESTTTATPSSPAQSSPEAAADQLEQEVARRRTFAIISHPDAGKTTLTEKLLMYGGAIHLAGAVKARRAQRHVTSDWMELERKRGISVTSSVMQFEYAGCKVNLLDTPGHQDFSEDTYRTLVAADSAVMLLDNRKGVEERTRQLFEVCKRRRVPIFTFVNKCDRAGEKPLKLLSDVESDLGIACYPVTWPIVGENGFIGVYDRMHGAVELFERAQDHGASRARARAIHLKDPELRNLLEATVYDRLVSEIELLDAASHAFDLDAVLRGDLSPMYFGSALTNFGVEAFFHDFLEFAPAPRPRESTAGLISPTDPSFTGFVFKIQANMDPKHRDRIAFVRICSGRFDAGMRVMHVRTASQIRLSSPQQFLARDRTAVEEAWPGDVIGIMDRGTLRIGDSLSTAGPLEFSDIPRFPPEHFARIIPSDPLKRKQLDTGLRELTEEGAAQVFYADTAAGPTPIVGAIGMLQFDVMQYRLDHEYGAPCRFEPLSYQHPRWVTGPKAAVELEARKSGHLRLYDTKGNPVLLFDSERSMRWAEERDSGLKFHEVAP